MRSAMPKVLHQVGGLSIVGHVVNAAVAAGLEPGGCRDGARARMAVRECGQRFCRPTCSSSSRRSARAPRMPPAMARPLWQDAEGYVAVVYGDHPLLRGGNFNAVLSIGWPAVSMPPFSASSPRRPHRLRALHHRWRPTAGDPRAQGRLGRGTPDRALQRLHPDLQGRGVSRAYRQGEAEQRAEGILRHRSGAARQRRPATRSATASRPRPMSWASTTGRSWREPRRSSRNFAATTS